MESELRIQGFLQRNFLHKDNYNQKRLRNVSVTKRNFLFLFSAVGLILISIFLYGWLEMNVSSEVASEVLLEYHYFDKDISVKLIDMNDVQTLKGILKGKPFRDNPSCGFYTEISINMTNDSESIVFCPANDGCPLLRINSSGKYIQISELDKIRLHNILEKYGMIFPCV